MRSHGMSQSHNFGLGTHHEGIVWVMAAIDRRSWSLLRGRFSARAAGKGPWKLPEPWTPRTRPPLLGKPHRTRFPTDRMNRLVSLVTW